MIAALFVDPRGCYAGLDGVDLWDESRDARLYDGPHPVVAHPPCSRWCRLAGLVEARWGHRKGDDGGCFASALASVRRCGGVLEHPAQSDAWSAHDLNKPVRGQGWSVADELGGWTCYVEQGRYGHPAKKATWLYAIGVDFPQLRWGSVPYQRSQALVSWCGNHVSSNEKRPRVGKRQASATPHEFRDILLEMARSAETRGANTLAPAGPSVPHELLLARGAGGARLHTDTECMDHAAGEVNQDFSLAISGDTR